MNFEAITEMVMEMTALPFFPGDPAARLAIVRMVGNMARNEDQVRWLVNVMTSGVFQKWEGPSELRAVFCQKFKPRDGIECVSAVYPDGMTREQLNPGVKLQLPAAAPLQLGAGDPISADPELVKVVTDLAPAKNLNKAVNFGNLHVPTVRSDESEYAALTRAIAEEHEKNPRETVRPATAEEIANLKAEQDRNRKESVRIESDSELIEVGKEKS